jgi:selenocysteine-specific elongation factor
MDIIVGTAGHIDHGKTSLVKALTGIDADRLPEEKRRGITVDLGFAEMTLGDVHFGFVDVPGHERFVKNMLAGASGIDIVLLVVAADEGVMPQTREHFDICRLLGVENGAIALTKTDLVDDETIELAKLDVAELVAGSFLENAPLVEVSARSGDGIGELNETLVELGRTVTKRDNRLIVRLPIDRSFSVKGFGAVVTGTLASGAIEEGDELELLPAGSKVRVRGIQTHGAATKAVSAGRRVAINLGGIDHSKVERGMFLVEPGVLEPTQTLDAEVEVVADAARSLRTRQRVRVHIGTVEALARMQVIADDGEIAAGEKGFVQIRLESPVVAIPGERFIIRRYSPAITIAGGVVIDNAARRHRKREFDQVRAVLTERIAAKEPMEMVRLLINSAGSAGSSIAEIRARTGFSKEVAQASVAELIRSDMVIDAGGRILATERFAELGKLVESAVATFHKVDPLAKGIGREMIREKLFAFLPDEVFQAVLSDLAERETIVLDRDTIRSSAHRTELSTDEQALRERILASYRGAGLEVPKFPHVLIEAVAGTPFSTQDARKFFQMFLDSGEIVKVSEEFYFYKPVINALAEKLRNFAAASPDRMIDMAKFKNLAGVSRKYAIPLLEYFDRERVTYRRGDNRYII